MINGFESIPQGRMLAQVLDLGPNMGLAYERSVGFYKEPHHHDRPILVFPRGACRMKVDTFAGLGQLASIEHSFSIDSSQFLLLPAGLVHNDSGVSTIYDTIALLPSMEWVDQAIKDTTAQGGTNVGAESIYAHSACLRRTPWLDALINRYFFEKIISTNRPPGCDFYLEKQILNEVIVLLYQFRARSSGHKRDESDRSAPVFSEVAADEATFFAEQTVRYLESRIFERISISEITSHLRTSESTLRRHFQASFGMTIGGYIKARRLDEAALLLKRGDLGVEDVCLFVGYADVSSFSKAFKAKFGVSPKKIAENQ